MRREIDVFYNTKDEEVPADLGSADGNPHPP